MRRQQDACNSSNIHFATEMKDIQVIFFFFICPITIFNTLFTYTGKISMDDTLST